MFSSNYMAIDNDSLERKLERSAARPVPSPRTKGPVEGYNQIQRILQNDEQVYVSILCSPCKMTVRETTISCCVLHSVVLLCRTQYGSTLKVLIQGRNRCCFC